MGVQYKKGSLVECEITHLLPEGSGYAFDGHHAFVVSSALPGELVRAELLEGKTSHWVAIAREILRASPDRKQPLEDHYHICSPWQILDFQRENAYKRELTKQVLSDRACWPVSELSIIAPEQRWGYRNKMEFSFTTTTEGITLAFHQRGQGGKVAIQECQLSVPVITKTSRKIEAWLRKHHITEFQVKTLLLRCNRSGQVVAGLFVMNEDFAIPDDIKELQDIVQGFAIFYSEPRSPASVITKVLYQQGNLSLQEILHGHALDYGLNSFFQIHLDIFSQALDAMRPYVQDADVLDYYSGVGTISIALSKEIRSCLLLESCEEAVFYAKKNLESNHLPHFQVLAGRAEDFAEHLHRDKVLIVDPPRFGLAPKFIRRIRNILPRRIIYLSCNIISLAENLLHLLPYYNPIHYQLYNFFPASPHSEFLTILERR